MSAPQPWLGDYGEPPGGDYARYIERLLQSQDLRRGVLQAGAAAGQRPVAVAKAAAPAAATTAPRRPAKQGATQAVTRTLPAKWPLLLGALLVLLMWFAPALLPFVMAGVILVGVGHGVWKSRHGRGGGAR